MVRSPGSSVSAAPLRRAAEPARCLDLWTSRQPGGLSQTLPRLRNFESANPPATEGSGCPARHSAGGERRKPWKLNQGWWWVFPRKTTTANLPTRVKRSPTDPATNIAPYRPTTLPSSQPTALAKLRAASGKAKTSCGMCADQSTESTIQGHSSTQSG